MLREWWRVNGLKAVRFWKNCTWLFKVHKRGFCFPFSAIFLKLSRTQLPPSVTLTIPHKTPLERYLFEICVTLDIFPPEIETQNRRDLVRIAQLICNSFRTSTHPGILTPLLCSDYKVQLLLHVSVLPVSCCLLGKYWYFKTLWMGIFL